MKRPNSLPNRIKRLWELSAAPAPAADPETGKSPPAKHSGMGDPAAALLATSLSAVIAASLTSVLRAVGAGGALVLVVLTLFGIGVAIAGAYMRVIAHKNSARGDLDGLGKLFALSAAAFAFWAVVGNAVLAFLSNPEGFQFSDPGPAAAGGAIGLGLVAIALVAIVMIAFTAIYFFVRWLSKKK